jgi:hypothetical protein
VSTQDFVRVAALLLVDSHQRALLINADNTSKGWTNVYDALDSGNSFAIRARDGVLPVEADSPQEETWADRVATVLSGIGCTYIKAGSGGGAGHVHYWFVGPPGWTTGELAVLAKAQPGRPRDLKIRVTDDGRAIEMRPPSSPHRAGGHGSLIYPKTPDAALRALQGVHVPVSAETVGLLRDGDTKGRFRRLGTPSRTTLVQSLATRYINARLPFERLLTDLTNPNAVAGVKLREQGSSGRRWLSALWEEQRQWVRSNPPDAASADALRAVIRTVWTRPWNGRSATSDSRVYRAMVDRAVIYGFRAPIIAIDQRTLALTCCHSQATVAAAIRRLIDMKLVSVERKATRRQATTYRLHADVDVQGGNDIYVGGAGDCIDPLDVYLPLTVHDLFRTRAGNPPGSLETFIAVPDTWATVSAIRECRIGASTARTLRSHLTILESEGLVERNSPRGHNWRRRPDAHGRLDVLAEWRGTAGAEERQRQEYDEQRYAYAASYTGVTGRTPHDADRAAS